MGEASGWAWLTAAEVADDDFIVLIDKSDTTMAPTGTNKRMLVSEARIMASQVASVVTINLKVANYQLVLADANNLAIVGMNLAGANNLTVPPNATVAFPIGTQIDILQVGAGQTTVVAGGGVTVSSTTTLKLAEQYARAVLLKTGIDAWILSGELALT